MIDFEKEIAKYGKSLSAREQDKARAVFNELLAQGRSFEWLYYAIKHFGNKSILNYPRLMFYSEFQEEVDEIMAEARERERAHEEWKARICAGIEKQIIQAQNAKVIVIHRQRKPKERKLIDLASIAEMEDDEDDGGAPPKVERIEKTDSTEDLVRRVRGY